MAKLLCLIVLFFFVGCVSNDTSLRNTYYGKNPYKKLEEVSEKVIFGKASFYGAKYQGRKTANGETFDMYDYTCAHKTLPFNTELKVTYLKTKKSIVVRVNDRGPFVGDRIIDLTRQAAEDIGLLNDGVGEVKIEIL